MCGFFALCHHKTINTIILKGDSFEWLKTAIASTTTTLSSRIHLHSVISWAGNEKVAAYT